MTESGRPTSTTQPPAKRRKHLMDPDAPRPVRDVAREQQSLSRVQKWVMSTLAVSTLLHLSLALVVLAMTLSQPRLSSQIGLNVIASAFGVIAVVTGLAIHGRKVLSPWLLLGLLPGAIGLWLTLGQ